MSARLQQHLEQAIATAADPVAAGCLRAELAVLRARLGYAEEAEAELAALAAEQATDPVPTRAAWLALARGLVGYYGHKNELAFQPLARAQALATAARVRPVQALAAAWLAHMHYVGNDPVLMARHAAQALQEAAPNHHSARSRACLVVAQGYHYAGALEPAQRWYRRAHEHAVAEGDVATLAALLHNRAWIDATNARLERLYGAVAGSAMLAPLRDTMVSAESMAHLNSYLRIGTEDALVPMLKALLLVLSEQPAAALELFAQHLDAGIRGGMHHHASTLLAERAWCHQQVGEHEAAAVDADAALSALAVETPIDNEEVASTVAWVALLRRQQGRADEADALLVQGHDRLQAYQQLRRDVLDQLELALAQVSADCR